MRHRLPHERVKTSPVHVPPPFLVALPPRSYPLMGATPSCQRVKSQAKLVGGRHVPRRRRRVDLTVDSIIRILAALPHDPRSSSSTPSVGPCMSDLADRI